MPSNGRYTIVFTQNLENPSFLREEPATLTLILFDIGIIPHGYFTV